MGNYITKYLETLFDEVDPIDFYKNIYRDTLDNEGAFTKGRYVGISVELDKDKDGNLQPKRHNMYSDNIDECIADVQNSENIYLMAPVSYAGKSRNRKNARFIYGLVFDVDYLKKGKDGETGLRRWLYWADLIKAPDRKHHVIPTPTYLTSSGTGMHAYYIFDKPIAMYRNITKQLHLLKKAITKVYWKDWIVEDIKHHKIQIEAIDQAYRMPGSVCSSYARDNDRVRAFKSGNVVTVEYLNKFVKPEFQVKEYSNYVPELPLAEAKEKYPDWYQKRIVEKRERGSIAFNRAIYDSWLRRIKEEAVEGGRYWAIFMLAAFAKKASFFDVKKNPNPVTKEELERDAYRLLGTMKSLDTESNPFTADDITSALSGWESEFATRFNADYISEKSQITIIRNKRNGRKQSEHIKLMNFVRDEINKNITWNKIGNGRKPKKDIVFQWIEEHPDGRKIDCHRDTGLSRTTIDKWWKDYEKPSVDEKLIVKDRELEYDFDII